MRKRQYAFIAIIAVLLVPSLIFAGTAHQFAVGKAAIADNTVTIPLNVTNEDNLTAMDIPLKFSDGVTLKEVTFENTRVSYFDLKIANIDNQDQTVVIGLLPQMTPEPKPDLSAGSGTVANLVFEITDPTITEISLEAVEMRNPGHSLVFIYHDIDEKGVPHSRAERPVYEGQTVLLKGEGNDPLLPASFGLAQNYPNPFNPTTSISFDLPVASHVELDVFNILGQKVTTLVNGEMEAGTQVVEFDASPYSTGIYFYRLNAGDFSDTRKMLLVK